MILDSVRHNWPEKAGFTISRPHGLPYCTFVHFCVPVQILLDGEYVQTRPGACIFYGVNQPQWYHSPRPLINNWMHPGPEFSELLRRFEIPENTLLYPGDTAFISELFQKLEREFYSDSPYRRELMDGYIQEFVIRFHRALHQQGQAIQVSRQIGEKMRLARETILSQPERSWSVAEMARLASLSPSRFHALYKAPFATSPLQDAIAAKIRYAQSLLLSDERPTLTEVAERLGYNDQYHFIRQFKAVTGKTPGAYRKEMR